MKILQLTQTWTKSEHDRIVFIPWDKSVKFKHNFGSGRGKSIIQYKNLYFTVLETINEIIDMVKKEDGNVF